MKCTRCHGTGLEVDHVTIGWQMRCLRKKRGVSLRSVAKVMGFTAPYLSDLETGKRPWSGERISLFRRSVSLAAKRA